MGKFKKIITAVLLISIIYLTYNIQPVKAGTFSTGFETLEGYSVGSLNGQNGWIGNSSYQISTNNPFSGNQNITVADGNIRWQQIRKSFAPQTHGDMSFYMAQKYDDRYASSYSLAFGNGGSQIVSGSESFQSFAVGWNSNHPYWGSHAGQLGFGVHTPNDGWVLHDMQSFSAMTYYKIRVKWDTDAGIVSVSINDGPFESAAIQNFPIDTYEIQFRSSDPNDLAYFDDIQDIQTSPSDQIADIIKTIKNFNLEYGTENSMTVKLQNALAIMDSANNNRAVCNLLSAFTREVNAQSRHAITVNQADQLITQAQEIRNSLNCN